MLPLVASLACASRGPKEPDTGPLPDPSYSSPSDTSNLINRPGGKTVESLFAGRFPGVSVKSAPNGGLEIRIRGGSTTFYGGEEPLYVIDGTPMAQTPGGVVFLNPYDIQKIEVLKNPADTGVYGMRGANGVILITTKRP